MAVGTLLVSIVALVLSSSACQSSKPNARDSTAVLAGDTTHHVLSTPDREIVTRARELDRADKRDSARVAYEEAAQKLPVVADWLYLRAAGVTADSAARAGYYAKVRTPVARNRIRWTEAQALERTGDIQGAIRTFAALGSQLDVLRLRVSPLAGDTSRAAARGDFLSFISKSGSSSDTRDAIALFDKVFTTTTPAEELTIARAADKSGVPDRAVKGYSRALKAGLGTVTDRFSYGEMLYRLRRYDDAAAQFSKVRSPSHLVASAQYQRARAQVALGNIEAGRKVLRSLTTSFPKDSNTASALALLSDLASDENRDGDARSTVLGLVRRFPSSRLAPNARFRAAMIAFIRGDRKSAASEFDALVSHSPNSSEALAAAYWAGRSYAALGDSAKARTRWRSIIAKDPLSYYSVVSAKRLDTTLVTPDRTASEYPRVPAVDTVIGRIAVLKDVGMDVEAGFESDRLFRDATDNPTTIVAAAHALAGSDQASRSIALGRRALDEIGPTPANYRLYFPVLERETLISSARENDLDPVFVASLIRQESNFNPRATSPAGARGLMQLMPSVGQSLASAKGIQPWDADMLYQPDISIRLGTAHLKALAHKYPEVEKVLAAYNAGESRVTKWSTKTGSADPEVFTERIPFVETRDYVRIILRNQAYYKALYPW